MNYLFKLLVIVLFLTASDFATAQSFFKSTDFQFGITYNQSNDEFNNTSGIGLILESNYYLNNRYRIGIRLEPVALVSGVFVYPGGCEHEHPRYPDINSCREGSNHLLNGYLKSDYIFPKNETATGNWFAGAQLSVLTQNRYIITQRIPANWLDTEEIITNLGCGLRFGYSSRRMEYTTSFIIAGKDYHNYLGFNIAYKIKKRRA